MGFLRKVGRKIKKGVKKLFSTKLGSLIGGIAISMMLGPLLGRAWNGLKGAFTGTGATAGQAVSTAEAGVAAAEVAKQEVAKQALGERVASSLTVDNLPTLSMDQLLAGGNPYANIAAQGAPGVSMEAVQASFTQGAAASRTAMQTAIQNGNALDFTNVLSQGTANGTIPLNISETVTGSLNNIDKFIETGEMFTPEVQAQINLADAKRNLETVKSGATPLFGDKNLGKDIKQNFVDFGTKVSDTIKDPSSLIGPDFVPDTVKSVAGAMAIDAVLGEEIDEGGYGRMPGSFGMESPQASYVAQVKNQIPTTPVTNMQQMNQGLFFGTLSPQFLLQQQQYYS
jgi:hypothetical protein